MAGFVILQDPDPGGSAAADASAAERLASTTSLPLLGGMTARRRSHLRSCLRTPESMPHVLVCSNSCYLRKSCRCFWVL